MNLIPTSITRGFASSILKAKHNSPHLFFAAGVAGVIGATYLACKGTLKVESTIDKIKEDVNAAKKKQISTGATEQELYRELGVVYFHGAVELGKIYGPAVVVGGLAVASLTGSHVQLARRNAALSAAFASLSKAYNEYRARVRAVVGEEKELDIHRNLQTNIVNVDGKKEAVKSHAGTDLSPYARCFDEASTQWQKYPDLNYSFVKLQEVHANHQLNATGHIFLNEVYDMLGFDRTEAGQIVGWVKNGEGDNYVDFGLHLLATKDFIEGYERSAWLDFNVDGPVLQLIGERV